MRWGTLPLVDPARLDEVLSRESASIIGEPGVLLGWYLIAEVIDSNGELRLIRMADEQGTTWRNLGYLGYAFDHEDEDEEEVEDDAD